MKHLKSHVLRDAGFSAGGQGRHAAHPNPTPPHPCLPTWPIGKSSLSLSSAAAAPGMAPRRGSSMASHCRAGGVSGKQVAAGLGRQRPSLAVGRGARGDVERCWQIRGQIILLTAASSCMRMDCCGACCRRQGSSDGLSPAHPSPAVSTRGPPPCTAGTAGTAGTANTLAAGLSLQEEAAGLSALEGTGGRQCQLPEGPLLTTARAACVVLRMPIPI